MGATGVSFAEETRQARKVLVVFLGFFGDSIHILPSLRAILAHYGEDRVDIVTTRIGAEVMELGGIKSRVICYPIGRSFGSVIAQVHLLWRLRSEKYDVVISLSAGERTYFTALIAGAAKNLQLTLLDGSKVRKQFLQGRTETAIATVDRALVELVADAMERVGFLVPDRKVPVEISEGDHQWAGSLMAPGAIHVSINSAVPMKEWPLNHWIEAIKEWIADGRSVVATGSGSERERVRLDELEKAVGSPGLCVVKERLRLGRVAALLQRCSVHVGPDSGVVHLAWAVGTPCVGIYRESWGLAAWLPPGEKDHALVVPCPCLAGEKRGGSCRENAVCLAAIPVKDVSEAVLERVRGK
jgi:ADP-heptose:LPS heptosyltransferase